MQKVQDALIQSYLKARMEMLSLEQEEDGMETVETVILIAVAVIVAGGILTALGKNGNDGLIGSLFTGIKNKFGELFDITLN